MARKEEERKITRALNLTLITDEIETGLRVQAIVTIETDGQETGHPSLSNEKVVANVELTHNTETWCVLTIGANGHAHAIKEVPFGTHVFHAWFIGTKLVVTETCTRKAPQTQEKKPPTKLRVDVYPKGPASTYQLLIQAIGESGGVANWPLCVFNPKNKQLGLETQKDGSEMVTINIPEPGQVVVIVSLLGTDLAQEVILQGPLS